MRASFAASPVVGHQGHVPVPAGHRRRHERRGGGQLQRLERHGQPAATIADKDGIWSADFDLPAGKISYKFVVNGDQWLTDEGAADFEPDGFGGQNSVVTIADKPLSVGYGTAAKKAVAPAKMGLRRVAFEFKPDTRPEQLWLCGTFNDWTIGKTALTDPDGDGKYSVTLLLAPGTYQYKFVIGTGGWTQDKAGQDGETRRRLRRQELDPQRRRPLPRDRRQKGRRRGVRRRHRAHAGRERSQRRWLAATCSSRRARTWTTCRAWTW